LLNLDFRVTMSAVAILMSAETINLHRKCPIFKVDLL
jgi:hypothetical protein